ncbi:MAG: hypothetical protein QOH68_2944 [Nocardioidaceae bacterium]|jgi:Tol biopolymer transport system component|nr:hypothetical protein [Nocardioidaceae bacterium]
MFTRGLRGLALRHRKYTSVAALLACALGATPASGSFPGTTNGSILGRDATGRLSTVKADGTGLTPVLGAGVTGDGALSWGGGVVVYEKGGNLYRVARIETSLIRPTVGRPTQLTATGSDRSPVFSPDGRKIAFIRTFGGAVTSAARTATAGADPGEADTVQTEAAAAPADAIVGLSVGQTVADTLGTVTGGGTGQSACLSCPVSRLYAMDANGANVVALTDGVPALDDHAVPVWAPDGQSVGFIGRDPSGSSAVYLVDLSATGASRVSRVPGSAGALSFDWSPDSQQIAVALADKVTSPSNFASSEPNGTSSDLAVLDLAGSSTTLVDNSWSGSVPAQTQWVLRPQWAPDGQSVVYREETLTSASVRTSRLVTVPVGSSQAPTLLGPAGQEFLPLSWTQDCGFTDVKLIEAATNFEAGLVKGLPGGGTPGGVVGVVSTTVGLVGETVSQVVGNVAGALGLEVPVDTNGLVALRLPDGGIVFPPPTTTQCDKAPVTPSLWPAPLATTGSATAGQTTATINGTINRNGSPTSYHFEWGTTSGYGNATPTRSNAATGSKSELLTGLSSGTTYHYRIVASSRGGTTAGADRTFTTSVPPPSQTSSAVLLVHGVNYDVPPASINCNSDTWPMVKNHLRSRGISVPLVTIGYYRNDTNCDAYLNGADSESSAAGTTHSTHRASTDALGLGGHQAGSLGTGGHTTGAPIEHLGYHLAWYIYNHYTKFGQTIQVVAHSMGGLITRYALAHVQSHDADFPPKLYVRDVVTLGTPFGGTSTQTCYLGMAVALWPEQCNELQPNSGFLNNLQFNNARSSSQESTLVTDWSEVGSSADGVVPKDSATQASAQHKYIYENRRFRLDPAEIADGAPSRYPGTYVKHSNSSLENLSQGLFIGCVCTFVPAYYEDMTGNDADLYINGSDAASKVHHTVQHYFLGIKTYSTAWDTYHGKHTGDLIVDSLAGSGW